MPGHAEWFPVEFHSVVPPRPELLQGHFGCATLAKGTVDFPYALASHAIKEAELAFLVWIFSK